MPTNEKSQKRVKKLFSELEQFVQPLADSRNTPLVISETPTVPDEVTANCEVEALRQRVRELEAELKAGKQLAAIEEKVIELPLAASVKTMMEAEPTPDQAWTTEETRITESPAHHTQTLSPLIAEQAHTETQNIDRQTTQQNWESFLDGIHNSERIGFLYDQTSVAPFADSSPEQADLRENIQVFNEQIGNLFLKTDPNRPLTNEDKEMVSAVAQQVAQQVENLRLLADASRARADAEEATRRLTRQNWQSFNNQKSDKLGFAYDSIRVLPVEEVREAPDISFTQPLQVRGETIGQLAVAGLKTIPPEAVKLANNIAEQVGIHVENLRLFELNEKRARELETVAVVSTTASTTLDPDLLLQSVVDLTKERFNLYHAHIYLADESWNTLLLAAGAGDIGRQMVSEGWAIPMNHELSIVASAARNRQSVIANDISRNKFTGHLSNYLLSETRSEMAIPMVVGETLLGVFDVQADTANYFTDEDSNIYTTLALQVAVALQNARLYQEQSATVTQLRELDRLKSSFLANMSHELRTPLNSILGFADVMLEELDGPLTENMKNDLGLVYKNGQHLLHLINDVLDMAKIESGKMNLNLERFNLHEVIEEVTGITSTLASEKNLALFIEADSDHEVEVHADKIRLRQVLINLVNNAIKFTEKGRISIHVTREQENVLIAVKDTGIGIPTDHLEAIFQEFTQVDTSTTRKAGGTGLGLPISRRLINMHGGRLWVESTGVDGEGSTFYVFLPIEARIKEEHKG